MGVHMIVRSLGHVVLGQLCVSTKHAARGYGKRRSHVKHHTAEFCPEFFLFFAKKVSSIT